jgi:hypothetical protein
VRKWAHNAPHDRHALENEGVEIRGLEDTLQWARVAVPGMRDYGLKGMEQWALGYAPRPTFMDMVSYDATVVHARGRRESGCICGKVPCRARSTTDFLCDDGVWRPHIRVTWKVFTPIPRIEHRRYDVRDFVPGAPLAPLVWAPTKDKPNPPGWWKGVPLDRWTEWVNYSAADAIRGMELVDWLRNQKQKERVYPWVSLKPSPARS